MQTDLTAAKKEVACSLVGQLPTVGFVLLKLFLPTNVRGTGEEMIMDVLNAFDVRLIPWIFVLNISGHFLKKMNLPKFVPPVPVLLILASFFVCCGFGWAHTDVTGAKQVFVTVVEYGLGNGLCVAGIAIMGYDTFKGMASKLAKQGGKA